MRLTRLREDGGDRVLDLHPRLTVVVGLRTDAYPAVVGAIVERATAEGGSAAVVDTAAVLRALDGIAEPRTARLRSALAEATAAAEAVERSIRLLDAELRSITVRREQLGAELTILRTRLDPAAAAAVEAAEEMVRRLTLELGAIPGTGLVDPVAALRARVADLQERLDLVRAGLDVGAVPDRTGLQATLEHAAAVLATRLVPSSDALALADEWDRLRRRLAEVEARHATPGEVDAASDRVEAARADLRAALATGPSGGRPSGTRAALEAGHARVLAAEERLAAVPDDASALAALDLAASEEQELLAELGVASWSAYVLRDRRDDVPDVTAARATLAEAEAAWTALVDRLEADPDFDDLLDALAVCEHSAQILLAGAADTAGGAPPVSAVSLASESEGPGDLGDRLRAVRVAPPVLGIDGDVAAARLREALGRAAVPADDDESLVSLAARARSVLEGAAHRQAVQERLHDAEALLLDRLAEAQAALAEVEADPSAGPVELDDPRLAAAVGALDAARSRLRRNDMALARVTELVRMLDDLAADEERLFTQRDEQDALLEAARRMVDAAAANLGLGRADGSVPTSPGPVDPGPALAAATERALGDALAGLFADNADTTDEDAGRVLVVAGAFDGRPVRELLAHLDELVLHTGSVQVVVLSEDPAAERWAAGAPPDVAVLRRP